MDSNLILIGFQASGKTTLGRLISKHLNKVFIDIDDLIIQHHPSLNCREIVFSFGEKYFRLLESEAIQSLNGCKGAIIAVGGGSLLKESNAYHLKQNSLCVYLKTSREILKQRILNRPILPSYLDPQNPNRSFDTIYEQRIFLYEKYADRILEMDGLSIEESLQRLTSVY